MIGAGKQFKINSSSDKETKKKKKRKWCEYLCVSKTDMLKPNDKYWKVEP